MEEYIKNCKPCQLKKSFHTTEVVQNIITKLPWERIQIDLVDLRHYSDENDGYCWLLNVVDCFSKYLFSCAFKSKSSVEVQYE